MSTTTKAPSKKGTTITRTRVTTVEKQHRIENLVRSLDDMLSGSASVNITWNTLLHEHRVNWNDQAKSLRQYMLGKGLIVHTENNTYHWGKAALEMARPELINMLLIHTANAADRKELKRSVNKHTTATDSLSEVIKDGLRATRKRGGGIHLGLDELHAVGLKTLLNQIKATGMYATIKANILKQL